MTVALTTVIHVPAKEDDCSLECDDLDTVSDTTSLPLRCVWFDVEHIPQVSDTLTLHISSWCKVKNLRKHSVEGRTTCLFAFSSTEMAREKENFHYDVALLPSSL